MERLEATVNSFNGTRHRNLISVWEDHATEGLAVGDNALLRRISLAANKPIMLDAMRMAIAVSQ